MLRFKPHEERNQRTDKYEMYSALLGKCSDEEIRKISDHSYEELLRIMASPDSMSCKFIDLYLCVISERNSRGIK